MFFYRNVNHNVRTYLNENLGFEMTANLGKYLGVPLHHDRVLSDTYQFIVGRVKQKLSSWKSTSLSLACHNTLIKAVTQIIPNHVMQTSIIYACGLY